MKKKLLLMSAVALLFCTSNAQANDGTLMISEGFEDIASTCVENTSNPDGSCVENNVAEFVTEGSKSLHLTNVETGVKLLINKGIDVKKGDTLVVTFKGQKIVTNGDWGLEIRLQTTPSVTGSQDDKFGVKVGAFSTTEMGEQTGQVVLKGNSTTLYPMILLYNKNSEIYLDDFKFYKKEVSEDVVIVDPSVSISNKADLLANEYEVGSDITINVDYNTGSVNGVASNATCVTFIMKQTLTGTDHPTWQPKEGTIIQYSDSTISTTSEGSVSHTFTIPADYPTVLDEGYENEIAVNLIYGTENLDIRTYGYTYVPSTTTDLDVNKFDTDAKMYVSNGILYINSDNNKSIEIYSILGSLIKTCQLTEGENELSGLEEGLYIIDNKKISVK